MHKLSPRKPRAANLGFTLVEIALVLVVVSILAGGAIAAFRVQLSFTKISQAREQIREAREALINYAIANQQLPCAAADEQGVMQCAPQHRINGFLPWRDLGLPSSDPWGRPLRYIVTADLTDSAKIGFYTQGSLNVSVGGSNIDTLHAVAFSVWSTGEDTLSASSSGGTNTTVIAEAPGSDDIVEWESRFVLFGRMMAAGRTLPLTAASSSAAASSAASSSASSAASSASSS